MQRQDIFTVTLACSNDIKELMNQLVDSFNRASYFLTDGRKLQLETYYGDDENIVANAVGYDFVLLCLKSTFSIDEIEQRWAENKNQVTPAVALSYCFAATPVVFVTSAVNSKILGSPEKSIGWKTLQQAALINDRFQIMRSHGTTPDGRLISIAEHIAASSTIEKNTESVGALSFIKDIESSTREYGPNDEEVLIRALQSEDWLADIIVAKEYAALQVLKTTEFDAVVIYPSEGTLWIEIPIVLMSWADNLHKEVFDLLRTHCYKIETQIIIRNLGFHPAIEGKRFGNYEDVQHLYKVQTALNPNVRVANYASLPMDLNTIDSIDSIAMQWHLAKKPADVCLVVDISGSMNSSDKLPRLQSGLKQFLDRFHNPDSTVAIITFANYAKILIELSAISTTRPELNQLIDNISANGMTALIDAVELAISHLQKIGNSTHLQVIMLLTDGEENASRFGINEIISKLRDNPHIMLYGIAYGKRANIQLLEQLASVNEGFVVEGTPPGIEAVYKKLNTYV